MSVRARRSVRSPTISALNAGPVCIGNWTADRDRSVSLEVPSSIRTSQPPLARYGNGPNQVGSRSQTRSISLRIHLRLKSRGDAGFVVRRLVRLERVPALVKIRDRLAMDDRRGGDRAASGIGARSP